MTIIFDNTGFNIEYWSRFTESELIEHGMQQKFFKQHTDEIRRELLKQVFKLIHLDTPRTPATTETVQPGSRGCGFC
jgi:hypothetical protein